MLRNRWLHDNWEFNCRSWAEPPAKLAFSMHEWRPARIPGNVHLDLIHQGIIADPFVAMFELGCQWVDEEQWTYRTSFEFEPDELLPRRRLVFEGLDTVCEVRLNGECVGTHDNMFLPLQLEVSHRLKPGKNTLEVDFQSATEVGRARRQAYFERAGIPEEVRNFDERAFVRKAQYMFGWDWGPRLVSVGIWKPVILTEYRSRIVDVHVSQEHMDDGSVRVAVLSQIDGPGEVHHVLEGFDVTLHDGEELRIAQPRLWWPTGLGEQALYKLTTELREGNHVLDRRVTQFGLRRARLLRVPDSHGESFEFEINGKPIWALGANWIPDHSMPAAVTRERVRAQLERARGMNMNMLRVWGGGLYESDDFYSICDELGLMVWQDFPFACSYYPDDEDAQAALRVEAAANVTRLRNHPSLVIWCGNNENSTMVESKWGGAEFQPSRFFGAPLYESVLPEVLSRLDRSRAYVSSSPSGGSNSNCGGVGDQHTWDVWHGRGDWKYYRDSTARFSSEFGFASGPSANVWGTVFPNEGAPELNAPEHPIARWHDKTAKGFEIFKQFVELHYPASRTLEEWSYYSQLNQRDALSCAIEHFRRTEFCRGALIWQLNDCWPVQSWALIDFAGTYKAAAFDMKRVCAPLLASLDLKEDSISLWAILDNTDEGFRGLALIEAHDLRDGTLLGSSRALVELLPGQRRVILEFDVSAFERHSTIISASLNGVTACRLLCEPRALQLTPSPLSVKMLDSALRITSTKPLVDLHIRDTGESLTLLDDFVTLPRGGSVTLRTRGVVSQLTARSLAGVHSVVWEG